MAASFAQEIGALYLETSAKEDTNIHDLFIKLSEKLPPPPQQDHSVIRPAAAPVRAKKGCC